MDTNPKETTDFCPSLSPFPCCFSCWRPDYKCFRSPEPNVCQDRKNASCSEPTPRTVELIQADDWVGFHLSILLPLEADKQKKLLTNCTTNQILLQIKLLTDFPKTEMIEHVLIRSHKVYRQCLYLETKRTILGKPLNEEQTFLFRFSKA